MRVNALLSFFPDIGEDLLSDALWCGKSDFASRGADEGASYNLRLPYQYRSCIVSITIWHWLPERRCVSSTLIILNNTPGGTED